MQVFATPMTWVTAAWVACLSAGPAALAAATPKRVHDVVPRLNHYRVIRVLLERPVRLWLAEVGGYPKLFLSASSDDPQNPRHPVQLEGLPGETLDEVALASLRITVGPANGGDNHLLLVKLCGENRDVSGPCIERAQYLIRRARPIPKGKTELSVACSFPGNASIQITRRSPLEFRVFAEKADVSARDVALQYEMIGPEVIPGSQSCRILAPRQDEGASDFEYQANLSLANTLSMKGEFIRAGETRFRLVHMRPRAKNAEEVALLAIQEMSSGFDGGCTFEPPEGDPAPIPTFIVPLLDAYDAYLAMFPNGKEVASVLRAKAGWLSGCRHHQEAADLYGRIVEKYPEGELASYARIHRAEELAAAKKQTRTSSPRERNAPPGVASPAGAPPAPMPR